MASVRHLGLLSRLPAVSSVPSLPASSTSRKQLKVQALGDPRSRFPIGRTLKKTGQTSALGFGVLVGLGGALSGASMTVMNSAAQSNVTAVAEEESMAESNGTAQIDLVTEFMVNMSCEGCVKSVRTKVEPVEGVKSVDVDLANQIVRILGSASIKKLTSAIEKSGRDARLIGQGLLANFAVSASVAEFKGPEIVGVVRFAQVSMELTKIDASITGLTSGSHAWSINTYGDLTQGAASTGGVFGEDIVGMQGPDGKPLGDLGTIEADSVGEAVYFGTKSGLQVSELIGRSVVIYKNQDTSESGIAAAVIARSAGVGQNYKKLCTCDGTVIWESSNNDFVKL